jgi:hypothetical protein
MDYKLAIISVYDVHYTEAKERGSRDGRNDTFMAPTVLQSGLVNQTKALVTSAGHHCNIQVHRMARCMKGVCKGGESTYGTSFLGLSNSIQTQQMRRCGAWGKAAH